MVKCRFTSTETVGLLGMGAQDDHLDFHTAPEICEKKKKKKKKGGGGGVDLMHSVKTFHEETYCYCVLSSLSS